MRKPRNRNRTFQSHGAGKGSADRTTDDAAYRKNFDNIDWNRPIDDEDNVLRAEARGYVEEELSGAGAYPIGRAEEILPRTYKGSSYYDQR